MPLLFSRPFLDMVYHALDSPDDDYHALFVLCLLYAMSHNKGELRAAPARLPGSPPLCSAQGKRKAAFLEELPFCFRRTPTKLLFSLVRTSQVLFYKLKPQELVSQATWGEKGSTVD